MRPHGTQDRSYGEMWGSSGHTPHKMKTACVPFVGQHGRLRLFTEQQKMDLCI